MIGRHKLSANKRGVCITERDREKQRERDRETERQRKLRENAEIKSKHGGMCLKFFEKKNNNKR